MGAQQTLTGRLTPAVERVRQAKRAQYIAQAETREAEAHLKREIGRALGHDNFEISNVACTSGFGSHVYSPTTAPAGVGHRKCIFCECDDFDGF